MERYLAPSLLALGGESCSFIREPESQWTHCINLWLSGTYSEKQAKRTSSREFKPGPTIMKGWEGPTCLGPALAWIIWIVGGECGKQVMASCRMNLSVSWFGKVMWDNRSCNVLECIWSSWYWIERNLAWRLSFFIAYSSRHVNDSSLYIFYYLFTVLYSYRISSILRCHRR